MSSRKNPNPIDVHVGTRIRLRRTILGMSQEELGKAVGVTFQQIQKYEKGTNRVGSSRLHSIAGVMSVPVAYFFDGTGETNNGPALPEDTSSALIVEFLSTVEALALNRAFQKIGDPKVRRAVVELVRSLAGSED